MKQPEAIVGINGNVFPILYRKGKATSICFGVAFLIFSCTNNVHL